MEFRDQIRQAGVIGCGGAGFPTDVKLGGQAEHFIVNAVECEPLLGTDRYLLRHFADEILSGTLAAAKQVGAQTITIALKHAYRAEQDALKTAVRKRGVAVNLHLLDSFYPAGDEQVVVQEVTGRTVPPGGIPLAVGVVVDNVATMLAAARAQQNTPFTHKYLTVAGEVYSPTIVHAPVGTPLRECVRLAGDSKRERFVLVHGGPLMGKVIPFAQMGDAVVEKTTSGILVLPEDSPLAVSSQVSFGQMRRRAAACCIQCSYCTMLCPRYLLGHDLQPHKLMRLFALGGELTDLADSPLLRSASLCSLCGVCSIYACPMGLMPSKVNAALKDELARRGLRYQGAGDSSLAQPQATPRESRGWRQVPSSRIAARAGVFGYEGEALDCLTEAYPAAVYLPLKQGVGVAGRSLVKPGQTVARGELIASPPPGALGANLHASLSGIVTAVDQHIVIKGM